MGTYYGYVERNAEDQIDWNAIGKSMNDTLLAEQKRRDELKAQIDKDSVEFGETLSNYPEGNHTGMVDSSINFASDIQSYQLLQLRLLKAGKLKLRDYIRNREKLKQGTTQYYGLMEKYNGKFDEFMKLSAEGKTGARQAYLLAEVEGFGNLANTRPYINPTTGEISIGKQMLKDPSKPYDAVSNPYTSQMGSKPADFKTTQQLEFSLLGPQMSYDSSVAIDETVRKYAAKYQQLEKSGSSSTKITDITENPNFDASLRSYYNSYFESNPNNAADFLTDFVTQREVNGTAVPITYVDYYFELLADNSKPYDAETNPYVGLMMKPDPAQPGGGRMIADMDSESGKELKEFGYEKFKETVEAQLKKEIEYQRGFQASQTDKNAYTTNRVNANTANLLAELYSGDKGRVEAALTNLRGQKTAQGTITSISRSNDGVDIVYDYKNPVSFEFGDQNITDFVSGISSEFGIKDYKKALRGANISKGATRSDIQGTLTRERGPSEEAKGKEAWQRVTTIMNDRISNNKVNFPELQNLISVFGMTVELQDNGSYTLYSLNEKVGENLTSSKAIWKAAQANVSAENFERQAQTSVKNEGELNP